MDNDEIKTIEKTPKSHFNPEIFSHLLSTMTPSDLTRYLRDRRYKQRLMTDIPLSKLFFLFERERHLNTISHQIHLSETIELIKGTIVSDDIKQYRGLLLNIERTMIYFYLFYWFFRFSENHKAARMSFGGFSSFQYIFEFLWELRFPWGSIRPSATLMPIHISKIPKIREITSFQLRTAWQIAKCIERKSDSKSTLNRTEILSPKNVKNTGITGPIARASGVIPSLVTLSSIPTRQSAQLLLKYAYASDNNLLNVLRVSYAELILALIKISQLLKEFPGRSLDTSINSSNGEATSSFITILGECHLTVNISEDQVTYFNYIPPQMTNIAGFKKILSTCPKSLRPIILLFYDPEIASNFE